MGSLCGAHLGSARPVLVPSSGRRVRPGHLACAHGLVSFLFGFPSRRARGSGVLGGEKGPVSCGKQSGFLCGFRGLSGKVVPMAGGPEPFSTPCLPLVLLGSHSPAFSQADGPVASTLTPGKKSSWEVAPLVCGREAGWVRAEGTAPLVCGRAASRLGAGRGWTAPLVCGQAQVGRVNRRSSWYWKFLSEVFL